MTVTKHPGKSAASGGKNKQADRQEEIILQARANRNEREKGYRHKALKMYPWVCGRCTREFTHENLRELTVHHRDHNHGNNPPDGSNWELLCIYCHDNEHERMTQFSAGHGATDTSEEVAPATHNPFADLQKLLGGGE
ncbi:MAG: HNH nuclease family protein [Magnetococcales bacterium]|nr:HNH nuclease family protein [Magnetococcales bacterium]